MFSLFPSFCLLIWAQTKYFSCRSVTGCQPFNFSGKRPGNNFVTQQEPITKLTISIIKILWNLYIVNPDFNGEGGGGGLRGLRGIWG